jgi:hypothetical protein
MPLPPMRPRPSPPPMPLPRVPAAQGGVGGPPVLPRGGVPNAPPASRAQVQLALALARNSFRFR